MVLSFGSVRGKAPGWSSTDDDPDNKIIVINGQEHTWEDMTLPARFKYCYDNL